MVNVAAVAEDVRLRNLDENVAREDIEYLVMPVHAVTSFASGSAGAGFGMPYYSFGKPLRHGTEE